LNPVGLLLKAVVSVLVERDLHEGSLALLFGAHELVHDAPQLRLGLLDQAAHAPARVEQDRQLDR